jgi:hypothetical protein
MIKRYAKRLAHNEKCVYFIDMLFNHKCGSGGHKILKIKKKNKNHHEN